MATNPTKKKSSSHLLHDLAGLIFLFLAIFTLLSLFSFQNQDPSFFTASKATAKNLGGIIGSHWASVLLQVLGAASFMQAFIFLLAGVALFRRLNNKEWMLACANFLLLLIATAACFGLVRKPLHFGGANLSYGGLIGDLLGGFFEAYLNTAGAALLTISLFLFTVSVATKISLRDMGLYAWLLFSKAGIIIAGATIYAATSLWNIFSQGYDQARPQILKAFSSGFGQVAELFQKAKEKRAGSEKEEEEKEEPAISPHVPKIELASQAITNEQGAQVIPIRRSEQAPTGIFTHAASDESTGNNEEGAEESGPQIITDADSEQSRALFDAPGEMEASAGAKTKFSAFGFIKKAAKENEKNIKAALGKKIQYELPSLSFLNTPINEENKLDRDELIRNSKMLEEKLTDFNVKGQVTAVKPGPVVTMYEFKPAAGVKVNSITNMADDLALALSATSIRIVAPIPGRDVVGIEVPNKKRESVILKEIIGSETFNSRNHSIPIAIGKDILGAPIVADLKKMPHLLVAGTTGSGKSVFINSMIISMLYKFTPDDLKLILVDPKQLELAPYNDIPHLLLPVVTEAKKASLALNWTVQEMERRYRILASSVTRDQESYNKKFDEIGAEKMTALIGKNFVGTEVKPVAERMPKIVVIIDELADLMMMAKSDVENNICRLAQKARASGIHLVLATQRPSTDVITGTIKANLPTRICFKVSSKVDSRVIFDTMGAEKLVGSGDMLFSPPGESSLVRMHGAYISVEEVEQIANSWRAQGTPTYRDDILIDPEEEGELGAFSENDYSDPAYQQALEIAYSTGTISASYIQRRLRIGYNKAARFVEMMEAQGVVGPAEGSKPRPVLSRPGV